MERIILILYGGFATYIYGYGAFIAGRYHKSIFEGPGYWVLIDLITVGVFWYWGDIALKKNSNDDYRMNSHPQAYCMILLGVTLCGIINFIFPPLGRIFFDFPLMNFVVALGAGYHTINEVSGLFD